MLLQNLVGGPIEVLGDFHKVVNLIIEFLLRKLIQNDPYSCECIKFPYFLLECGGEVVNTPPLNLSRGGHLDIKFPFN